MKPSAAQDSQIEDARQDLPAKDSKQKWDDPEGSYRRGFEHGAHLTFESAKHLFDTEAGRERLRNGLRSNSASGAWPHARPGPQRRPSSRRAKSQKT
jgi:hypothetical protein